MSPNPAAAPGLTGSQFEVALPVLRSALEALAVQLRRCAPFSPIKNDLRAESAALRAVLLQRNVRSSEQAAALGRALATRVTALRGQQHRCNTPEFKRKLHAEEVELRAVQDALLARAGA